MKTDNLAILLGLALGVCFATLIIAKIAIFFSKFKAETRYLVSEIDRASDSGEYHYWRRELRCHYLRLIPFVTRRNVKKVYRFFFRRSKRAEKEKHSDTIYHILAPSIIGIAMCALCLCGASWAWFTASSSTGVKTIKSPSYELQYQIDADNAKTLSDETTYNMTGERCVITLTTAKNSTSGATGYCSIKIGDKTYYTEQIAVGSSFRITVYEPAGTAITITPKWGTYSGTANISNNGTIGTPSNSQVTQSDDAIANDATTAEEPTVPTTAKHTATENTTEATEGTTRVPETTTAEPTTTQLEITTENPAPLPETTTAATEPHIAEENEG